LFKTWIELFEYLVFMSVCAAGMVHASSLWIAIGALTLFLVTWTRWREIFEKAGRIDRQYRAMGALALWRAGLPGLSMRLYAKAHHVALVLGAKFGQDCLFLAVAYLLGMAAKWFWFDVVGQGV